MGSPSLESLTGLCTPWCVHVAATLRVAEYMEAGETSVAGLAAKAGCDARVLEGILSHLVGKGVFGEPEPGRYELNDAARRLLDPAARLGLDLDGLGGRMAHAWGTLLEFARTGRPAYASRYGCTFWEDLDAHPGLAADFDALIGPPGHGAPDPLFELEGGWERVRTVVDVGGGTGAMLAGILAAHPHVRGTLVDLPRTVARSGAIFAAAGVSSRTTTSSQSFFDPLPAGADVYVVRGVVNDWPGREAVALLRRCAEAAGPTGRVVVMKGVLAAGRRGGLPIEMVLVGGLPRTLEQFAALAAEAGLEVAAFTRQASGATVVECRSARP